MAYYTSMVLTRNVPLEAALEPDQAGRMRHFLRMLSVAAKEAAASGVRPEIAGFMKTYREIYGFQQRRVISMSTTMTEARERVTRETLEECERAGLTASEAAERLGIEVWQVRELRKEHGLTKPRRSQTPQPERRPEPKGAPPEVAPEAAVPTCRICGCTDEEACPSGCVWVEDPEGGDLCSTCYDRLYGHKEASPIGLSITDSGVYDAKMLLQHLSALVMFFESLETDDEFLVQVEIRRVAG